MSATSPAMPVHRRRKPKVVRAVHRALGVVAAALILLMSVTGGLLVVHHDLERLLYPERHVIAKPSLPAASNEAASNSRAPARAPIAAIVQQLATETPAGYRPLRVEIARASDETEKYLFVAPNGRTRWAAFVNPYTGETVWRGADQALFTPWLLHLHMHLRTGGWGYVVTTLAGICLVLLGVTGLFVYGSRLGSLWRRPLRLRQGWRTALTDLHRWVGLLSLYFSIVLGLTGAIYAGKTAPGQIAAPKPLGDAFDLRQFAPVEPAIDIARERFPDAEVIRIAMPTRATGALVVTVLHRDAPVWRKFSRIEFDPATGAVRAVHVGADASVGEKFGAMLVPLHFGLYGSGLTKAAYAVGGFAPALLAGSGMAIGWMRRRRKVASAEAIETVAAKLRPISEYR